MLVLLGPHAVNPGQAVEVVADVVGARSDLNLLQSGQFLVHAAEFSVVCDRGSLRMQFLEYRCFTVYCSQIDLQRGLPPGLGIERKGDESGQEERPAYRREDIQFRFKRSVRVDGYFQLGRAVPDDRRVERDFDSVEKAGIVARNRSRDPGRAVADDRCREIFRQRDGFLVFFCESRTARLRFFARQVDVVYFEAVGAVAFDQVDFRCFRIDGRKAQREVVASRLGHVELGVERHAVGRADCQLFAFGACTDIGFRADPYPVVRSEIGLDVDGRRFGRELDPLDFERARVTECERGFDDGARLPGVQSRDEARDQ
ncbi:hypothetical protein [Alistipes ihumii]|uniref:hypothetical protein n=1 Tax=Alistipes ihumii TaxID=1470347 RepID=UPI0023523A12|nr:hypothetical protein [Alistipes ihumii]